MAFDAIVGSFLFLVGSLLVGADSLPREVGTPPTWQSAGRRRYERLFG